MVLCFHPPDPALFSAMANSIMDLLQKSSSLALASVENSSPQAEGLRAIIDFAQLTASQHTGMTHALIYATFGMIIFDIQPTDLLLLH